MVQNLETSLMASHRMLQKISKGKRERGNSCLKCLWYWKILSYGIEFISKLGPHGAWHTPCIIKYINIDVQIWIHVKLYKQTQTCTSVHEAHSQLNVQFFVCMNWVKYCPLSRYITPSNIMHTDTLQSLKITPSYYRFNSFI